MLRRSAVAALFFCTACALEPPPEPLANERSFEGPGAPAHNLTEERVGRFERAVDYFPDKATFEHATQIRVEYHGHYKVATIVLAGAGQRLQVLMVQRGTPIPPGYPDADLVWVPVRRWSLASFHYGGIADILGVADRIISIGGSFRHATSPGLVRLIRDGRIRQHRSDEQTADLQPEVYLSWTTYITHLQDLAQHRALGILDIPMAEHLEQTPLGKTEWIKFFAMFFNKEAEANAHFARVADEYNRLAALVRDIPIRPRVFVNTPSRNGWGVYGGRNAAARMIADAGGAYVFADNPTSANHTTEPIERAFDRGLDADIWLIGQDWAAGPDLPGFFASNPYARELEMTRRGVVYLCGRLGEPNPSWDQGLPNPHWELADHIKLLHPDRLPDHELVFYQSLNSWLQRSQRTP